MPGGFGRGRGRAGGRVGTVGIAIIASTIVFFLLVWAAFSLGFERMQADLVISSRVTLEAEPVVKFNADERGWMLVRPADGELGTGPEYGSTTDAMDAMCAFSWTNEAPDSKYGDARTDEVATHAALEEEGYVTDEAGIVRLVNESGQSLELVYVEQDARAGLDTAVAARAFAGSGQFLMFTMKCEGTGKLDQEVFQETLLGVDLILNVSP